MKSGIYFIINIITQKYYVGSSKDIKRRVRCHFNNLDKNKHINPYLQNSYNKYSPLHFKIKFIFCNNYIALEQAILNNNESKYNISPLASCPPTNFGENNVNFSSKKYLFHHNCNGVLNCTYNHLQKKYGLTKSSLSNVVRGKRKTHKGWSIIPSAQSE